MAEAVYAPRIKLIVDAFQQARVTQVFPADFEIDLAIDALYGAVWYKVLIRFETVDQAYIQSLVAQTLGRDDHRKAVKLGRLRV